MSERLPHAKSDLFMLMDSRSPSSLRSPAIFSALSRPDIVSPEVFVIVGEVVVPADSTLFLSVNESFFSPPISMSSAPLLYTVTIRESVLHASSPLFLARAITRKFSLSAALSVISNVKSSSPSYASPSGAPLYSTLSRTVPSFSTQSSATPSFSFSTLKPI